VSAIARGPAGTRPRLLDRDPARKLIARAVAIDDRETDLEVRGFAPCGASVRALLELHGRSFASGFNAAIAEPDQDVLAARLASVDAAERGFAFEGSGMALALLDLLQPRGGRFGAFVERHGEDHVYLLHVGAGWALARLHRRPWARLTVDPLLRWLCVDGYGFHAAFFHPQRTVRSQAAARRLHGYARRVFDQGVGRALWFVETADPGRIAATIEAFAAERRGDLWSGAALAATYAGGADDDALDRLLSLGAEHRLDLVQGAAFAVAARLRAGHVPAWTRSAGERICGVAVEDAALATDDALAHAGNPGDAGSYERWRTGIRTRLAA
jgi:enediyne biosynthesis protein E3